jgi:hypothetical protein
MSATATAILPRAAERSEVVPSVLGSGEPEAFRTGIEAALAFWRRQSRIAAAERHLYALKYEDAQRTREAIGNRLGLATDETIFRHRYWAADEDMRRAEKEIEKLEAEWFGTLKP